MEKDYLLRVLKEAAKALSAFLFRAKMEPFEVIQPDLEKKALEYVGLSYHLLKHLSNKDLLQLLDQDGFKLFCAAQLFHAETLSRDRENLNLTYDAIHLRLKALDLLLAAENYIPDELAEAFEESLLALERELEELEHHEHPFENPSL
ncbi:MAG: hypothetical protein R2880_02710 [Deinococcales bacterium]